MNIYPILKYLHILSAVVALGANLTYALWLVRMEKEPATLPFTLRTIKIMDDWITNPAYVLLFPTGWWMASVANVPLTRPWIMSSLVLYVALSIIGLGVYSPTLKKQIAFAESTGSNSVEYKRVAARSTTIGIVLNVISLSIIFLMVAKPALW